MPHRQRPVVDVIAHRAARFLGALPPFAQRLIAGSPIVIDGQRLDREAQLGLRLLRLAAGTTFEELPLHQGRDQIDTEAYIFGAEIPIHQVDSLMIPGPVGDIAARVYRGRPAEQPTAALVYLHGGGWALGNLESADAVSRFLAERAGITVISVDYRLAPENPFPAGLEDALAAFEYVMAHADELGIDPDAVGVGGESAGGNLAAVVSLHSAPGWRGPAFQLLLNPVTDLSVKRASYQIFGTGYFLTEAQMDWYVDHYLVSADQVLDPRVSPMLTPEVSHAPPAYVMVAGFDVLRDEGQAYAHKLAQAGVEVTLRTQEGLIHGMVNATGVGHHTREVLCEVAGFLQTRHAVAVAQRVRSRQVNESKENA